MMDYGPYSADICLWKGHLRPISNAFLESITHLISLRWFDSDEKYTNNHNGFLMSTNQKQTFLYGEKVCQWISLQHQPQEPQVIKILDQKTIKQVAYCDDCFVILTDDGLIYLGGEYRFWNTDCQLKLLNNRDQCFEQISCGNSHLLLLTTDNELVAMGRNEYGQIAGTLSFYDHIISTGLNNVIQMDCGRYHSLALTDDHKVYSMGSNAYGQVGTGDFRDCFKPTLVEITDAGGAKIEKVVAGPKHSFFLMENGTLYGCGLKAYSLDESKQTSNSIPTRISIKNVTAITSGWSYPFSMAFTSVGLEDQCFCWGIMDQKEVLRPNLIEQPVESFSEASQLFFEMPITFGWTTIIKSKSEKSCSSNSISFWREHLKSIPQDFLQSIIYLISLQYFDPEHKNIQNGYIFSTFAQETFVYGQEVCQWISLKHQNGQPQLMPIIGNQNVIQVDYGYDYFTILTENGSVYLGADPKSAWKTDGKLKQISKDQQSFKRISCGAFHLLLLTTDNRLLAMGWNTVGQVSGTVDGWIGMVDTGLRNVIEMACGWQHSLILTNDRRVYSWGSNSAGQLGLGDRSVQRNKPTLIHFFGKNKIPVRNVVAGFFHSLFLLEDGTLYVCGQNDHGQLGSKLFGTSAATPDKLAIENIKTVRSGWSFRFTVALTMENVYLVWGKLCGHTTLWTPTKTSRQVESFPEALNDLHPAYPPVTFGWLCLTKTKKDFMKITRMQFSLWRKDLKTVQDKFLRTITHFIRLNATDENLNEFNYGYLMCNNQRQTFAYGEEICRWFSLEHKINQLQEINILRNQIIEQVGHGFNYLALLTNDGSVYLCAKIDSKWNTNGQLKLLNNHEQYFKQISCGYEHLMLLTTDNKLMAMGLNNYGQITGSGDSYQTMIDIGLENVIKMDCGCDHSLAITHDNEVYAWGSNNAGRLGLGDEKNRNKPTLIQCFRANNFGQVRDLAANDWNSFFLMQNGDLYGCGSNLNGELGSKKFYFYETAPRKIPVENVTAITSGWLFYFTMVFTTDNHLHVWGRLGDRIIREPNRLPIHPIESFSEASSFYFEVPLTFGWTRIVKSSSRAFDQKLEKVHSVNMSSWKKHFPPISGTNFPQSIEHLIALNYLESNFRERHNGYLMATNQKQTFAYGQEVCQWLPLKHQDDRPQLIEILNNQTVIQVDHRANYFVLLTENGWVYMGAHPDSKWKTRKQLSWMTFNDDHCFKRIACGSEHFLLLTTDYKLMVVGLNNKHFQIIGDCYETIIYMCLENVIKMDCGGEHSLAITNDGSVYSWGANYSGQLGVGDLDFRYQPTLIKFFDQIRFPIKDVVCGRSHSLFLLEDGQLYGCGGNMNHELGLKCLNNNQWTPIKLPIDNVMAIVSGWSLHFTMAFCMNNCFYVWGELNDRIVRRPTKIQEQIETFSEASSFYLGKPMIFGWTRLWHTPTSVYDRKVNKALAINLIMWRNQLESISATNILESITHFIALNWIASGPKHNGYIMSTWTKQMFVYGQEVCEWISLEHQDDRPQLIEILDNQTVLQVNYGSDYFTVLTNDGSVYLGGDHPNWGTNRKLKQINNHDHRFKRISCGYSHLLLLTNDNRLMALGWNISGQITGNDDSYKTMRDTGLENVIRMECGWQHSLALTNDGRVYSWGSNFAGQLGLGDQENRNKPTLIQFFDSINVPVKDVVAGSRHSLFLLEDGQLYGCGLHGPLGLENFDGLQLRPIKLPLDNVLCVVSGWSFEYSIAFTINNCFYVWGKLNNQVLKKPTRIEKSVQSFSGAASLYFQIPFTFGWNKTLAFHDK